jgi:hypothetical protein
MANTSGKRIPPPPVGAAEAAAEAQRLADELAQAGADADETAEVACTKESLEDGTATAGPNGSPIRPARKPVDPLGFKGATADKGGTLPRFDLRIS